MVTIICTVVVLGAIAASLGVMLNALRQSVAEERHDAELRHQELLKAMVEHGCPMMRVFEQVRENAEAIEQIQAGHRKTQAKVTQMILHGEMARRSEQTQGQRTRREADMPPINTF